MGGAFIGVSDRVHDCHASDDTIQSGAADFALGSGRTELEGRAEGSAFRPACDDQLSLDCRGSVARFSTAGEVAELAALNAFVIGSGQFRSCLRWRRPVFRAVLKKSAWHR
jgi:hypothetical protein